MRVFVKHTYEIFSVEYFLRAILIQYIRKQNKKLINEEGMFVIFEVDSACNFDAYSIKS